MKDRHYLIKNTDHSLKLVAKSVLAHAKQVEKTSGLGEAQWSMLTEIESNSGIQVSELANCLAIHRSTCSNSIKRLESKGLIRRHRNRRDQRSIHLYITQKGSALLRSTPKPSKGKLMEGLEQFSDNELQELLTRLEKLVNTLQVAH